MRVRLGQEVEKVRRTEGEEAVRALFGENEEERLGKSRL
jgi:hypothetical protein